jgi:hypothetical protein
VQGGQLKVDLVPAQVYRLTHPQTMPIRQHDHAGISVAITVALGRIAIASARVRSSGRKLTETFDHALPQFRTGRQFEDTGQANGAQQSGYPNYQSETEPEFRKIRK